MLLETPVYLPSGERFWTPESAKRKRDTTVA
jgi:hypothetical protein